jgi:hypothetical protein
MGRGIVAKLFTAFFLLLGSFLYMMAALDEHDVSHRRAGPGDMGLWMLELQRIISAGSQKILAGLCFVAGAILFTAGGRRPADRAPAEPVAPVDRPREHGASSHNIRSS